LALTYAGGSLRSLKNLDFHPRSFSSNIFAKIHSVPERNPKDQQKLNNPNLDVTVVEDWSKELFLGARKPEYLPLQIAEFGISEQVKFYKQATSEKCQRMVLGKILHTREVVTAGLDIVKSTSDIPWNLTQVVTTCFLHDLGRFEQMLYGTYSDEESNFDHGHIGAEKFKSQNWEELTRQFDLNLNDIYEAIHEHSRIKYDGDNVYVKLIRDADKLALFRTMPYWLTLNGDSFSKEALKSFLGEGLVKNSEVTTSADRLLIMASWVKDLNFSTTRHFFDDEGIRHWLEEAIATVDSSVTVV